MGKINPEATYIPTPTDDRYIWIRYDGKRRAAQRTNIQRLIEKRKKYFKIAWDSAYQRRRKIKDVSIARARKWLAGFVQNLMKEYEKKITGGIITQCPSGDFGGRLSRLDERGT